MNRLSTDWSSAQRRVLAADAVNSMTLLPQEVESSTRPMIGKHLAHYLITAKLGRGGMGVVYEAEDQKLKRRVALKLLPPTMAGNHELLARFRREAEIVEALSHPNVVSVHSIEETDGHHFLTMERVAGDSLDVVLGSGRMPLGRVLRIAEAIAAALTAAHERGVVHRDIKPANVMLTPDDHVKVLDFGLGKLMAAPGGTGGSASLLSSRSPLTQEGAILGTVSYMSPEQARGRPVDHRSDIFSLGCVLYEAVTGALPFQGASSIETLHRLMNDDPPPVEDRVPDAPPRLQRILSRALAKLPGDRYQTARDLAADLATLRRDHEAGVKRTAATAPRVAAEHAPRRAAAGRLVARLLAAALVLRPW